MAESKVPDQDTDKSLECSICFATFNQPKRLPCRHTFCLKCLQQYCEEQIAGDSRPCPLCRREFCVPAGGVVELPDNEFMIKFLLLKGVNISRPTSEEEKRPSNCDICLEIDENVAAEAFCKDCKQCLCLRCKKIHSVTSALKSHSVVEMEEKPSKGNLLIMKSNNCTTHSGEELKLYCCDCSKLICYICLAKDHDKHGFKLLQDIVEQKKEECIEVQKTVKQFYADAFDPLKKLQQKRELVLQEVSDAKQSVEEVFDFIVNSMTTRKNQLFDKIDTMRASRLQEIDNIEDIFQPRGTEVGTFLSYSKMVMERGTDCEIIRVADELHKICKEKTKSEDETPLNFGIQFLDAPGPTAEEVGRFGCRSLNTDLSTKLFMSSVSMNIQTFKLKDGFDGMTVLKNRLYTVRSSYTPHVMVHGSYTGAAKTPIDGIWACCDIALCSYNKVLYCMSTYLRRVFKINLVNNTVTHWDSDKDYDLKCMAVNLDHNLLITVHRNGYGILEYSGEGKLIRKLELDNSITGFMQIIQLSRDEHIIFHWGTALCPNERLCVISGDGKITKSYGGKPGTGAGELKSCGSLVLDKKNGHLYVNNERILVFSTNLILLAQIEKPESEFGMMLFFDSSSDRLFLGECRTGRVLIINSPHRWLKNMQDINRPFLI